MRRRHCLVALTLVVALAIVAPAFLSAVEASVPIKRPKFCKILGKSEIEIWRLSTDPVEAEKAITLVDRLLATNPSRKVKNALKTIKGAHTQLSGGNDVSQETIDAVDTASDVIGQYTYTHC
jgi:hypothetical protein